MNFEFSSKVQDLRARVQGFMDAHVHPNEAAHDEELARAADRWQPSPLVERLKAEAAAAGLWNLFWPMAGVGPD